MKTVDRQVRLIASTGLISSGLVPWDNQDTPEHDWYKSREFRYHVPGASSQDLIEFAGRACYQSFDRPNPATAAQRDYLKNIIEQRHFSVFEHSSATFYLTGVSRSFTHELIRHRHLSYSQLSQRFVDSSEPEIVVPQILLPIMQEEAGDPNGATGSFITERLEEVCEAVASAYEHITLVLGDIEDGPKRKQIREAARAVLPNMTATKIVVTGNMRAWRHFILMRATAPADREIRETAIEIYDQLSSAYPDIFQDFVLEEKDGHAVVSSPYGEEDY